MLRDFSVNEWRERKGGKEGGREGGRGRRKKEGRVSQQWDLMSWEL